MYVHACAGACGVHTCACVHGHVHAHSLSHLANLVVCDIRVVLGGDQDGVHTLGDESALALRVPLVLHSDL